MFQAFEWYVPDDHKHWRRLANAVRGLKAIGIDNMWIPPACKASSPSGNGYDIYEYVAPNFNHRFKYQLICQLLTESYIKPL